FTSKLGVGTTFTVELPIATDSSRPDSYDSFDDLVVSDPNEALINTRNIVYIEHNNEHGELLKTVIGALGISVCVAKSGQLGVGLVQKILPELVIMDILLPDMTGFEVMTILKANLETANIPIVIVSGGASENKVRRMLALGAVAYLPKPLDLDRLKNIISANLNSNTVRF
ncbi:MAG: response regulator, partial [Acidimicrobiales bacterium]|nr:response regulator [Acidimicrobiales bacterium]